MLQAGCLTQTTISGLDVDHSSLIIAPINQPFVANSKGNAVATAELQLRRSDDHPLAGAPVLFHSERCQLDPNQAITDANGRASVQVRALAAQGCGVDAVVLFQGTQTPVPTTAAVNFYLPADGNASVLPGQQLDLQATARRADNTVNTAYVGTVQVIATDSNATVPDDYAFAPSDYGNKIWLAGLVLRSAGVQTVRIVNAATGQPLQPDLQVQVQASQALSMRLQANPGTVAGAPFSAEMRVVDSFGGNVAAYAGTVQVTSSDPCATLPAPVTFTAADAGAKQMDGLVWRTSGQQLLQVTDTSNSALIGQALVEVSAAPGHQLRVQTLSGTVAGLALSMTVEGVDVYGNIDPASTAQLHFASSDAHGTVPADTALTATDSGRKAVTGLMLITAGDQNITVTDTSGALAPVVHPVHVDAAPAMQLLLNGVAQAQAGAAQDLRLQAYDAFGNAAVGFTGTVTFSGTDVAAQYPLAYRFGTQDAGQHVFAGGMTWITAGDQNVRASVLGGTLQALLPHVTVLPADANQFVFSNLASIHVACVAEGFTLTVLDAYGNLVNDYAGTLTLSSPGNTVAVSGPFTLMASDGGVKSFPGAVTPRNTGTDAITVSDGIVRSTLELPVAPGAIGWLELANLPAHVNPGSSQATVVVHDVCNNVATQATDTLHFSSSDPCALVPQDYTFNAGDNGQHIFGTTFGGLGPQTLTVSDVTQTAVTSATASTQVFYPCTAFGKSMNGSVGGVAQAYGVAGSFTQPVVGLDSSQNPTVAWTDSRSGEARTFVATYDPASQNWTGLAGSALGLGASTLDGTAGRASLVLFNDRPWVAWTNQAVAATGTSLQVQNYNGAWVGLGSNANDSSTAPGISGAASAALDQVQLAMRSTGTPCVAWRNTADGSIRLRCYAAAMNQWLGLGGSDRVSPGPDASDGGVALALTRADQPVVAWQARPGSVQQIYLAQWSGSSWQGLAGSDAGVGLSNTSNDAAHPALILDSNDRPWVAWDISAPTQNQEIYALHWDGSTWAEVGGAASNGGISANASDSRYPTLALMSNNQPVVAWEDVGTGDHAVFLKRYDGSAWSGVQRSDADWGISAQFGASASRPQMVLDNSDRPVVAFTVNNGVAFVCRWASMIP